MKKFFTQRRKDLKDAKAGQISLCVFAIFAPLREPYFDQEDRLCRTWKIR